VLPDEVSTPPADLLPVAAAIAPADADETARALAPRLAPWLRPLFGASFIRSGRLYDEFVHRLTLGIFRATHLETAARTSGTSEDIAVRAGLELRRARIPVDWILRRLSRRGVLAETDVDGASRFQLLEAVPQLDPGPVRDEGCGQDPSWLPSYVLADTVAQDYPAFLRGERTGEEICFSPARLRLWVEFFSNDNGLYAVNNSVGAGAVEQWMPPAPASVLELGGGLGSGAAAVLDRLRSAGRWPELREYRFTELVPTFLRRGRQSLSRRFPDASFLTFAPLDMNLSFRQQGITPGGFSLVYAVNTLHVARDLDFTLREISSALAPGGRLIISECIRPAPHQAIYVELIFNLMETFRSPVLHPVYRPNGGFLTPEQWRGAMQAAGFADVRALPDIEDLRADFPDFHVGAVCATRPA
jgi:SAM-dependent methyltransferase